MRFTGKVVIITGSGAGIGQAAAVAFAREGAKVVVNSVTEKSGAETLALVEKQGGEGIYVQGDVSKSEDVKKIVAATIGRFGTVDVLVNVAGIVIAGSADNTRVEDWDKMMDVNAKGTFMMIREVLPCMLEKHHGSIVNIASIAAQKGLKDRFAYSASKGAVLSMSHSLAAEYVDQGIRCNVVCPGTILTPSLQYRIDHAENPEAMKADFFARQPIGRLGKPEEVAEAILFAADDAAGFMTSAVVSINGGMII